MVLAAVVLIPWITQRLIDYTQELFKLF
jgi:flagellar biosynthesis protein FliQ